MSVLLHIFFFHFKICISISLWIMLIFKIRARFSDNSKQICINRMNINFCIEIIKGNLFFSTQELQCNNRWNYNANIKAQHEMTNTTHMHTPNFNSPSFEDDWNVKMCLKPYRKLKWLRHMPNNMFKFRRELPSIPSTFFLISAISTT